MADNSLRTPGTGETIASDDIAGVKWQRVKIGLGPDGTADDMLGNTVVNALASAARTATTASATQTNYNARGIHVMLTVTVASGTGGLQVYINGLLNAVPYNLTAAPTAITATGSYIYELYPGASAAAVGALSQQVVQRTAASLPRSFQINVVHNNATSYTYQLDYALIL